MGRPAVEESVMKIILALFSVDASINILRAIFLALRRALLLRRAECVEVVELAAGEMIRGI